MSVSGLAAYLEYGIQSNFTTALSAGAGTRRFGLNEKITALDIDEGMQALGNLNTPLVQQFAFGRFEGSLGLEYTLSNFWQIDTILGAATNAGAGPYTHTYDDSKTVRAMTVEVGLDTTTDRVLQLQKAVTRDLTISTAINEPVNVRHNILVGATPTTAGSTLDSSIPSDTYAFPFTMVHATLENPSGTTLAEVQNMELTMNPNIRFVYGPNSADAQNAIKGQLSLTGRFSLSVVNNTWWDAVRARAEPANNTLRMKFTNGDTSPATDERTVQITLTGLGLGSLSMPVDQYELVTEEIPFTARDVTVVITDNTATPP